MLTIARDFPNVIKKQDIYKGFEYIIVYHKPKGMSYYVYCWYIKLPENHPLNPYKWQRISTFTTNPTWKEKDTQTNNYWLGYDCCGFTFMEKRDKWSVEFFEPCIKATIECLIDGNFSISDE